MIPGRQPRQASDDGEPKYPKPHRTQTSQPCLTCCFYCIFIHLYRWLKSFKAKDIAEEIAPGGGESRLVGAEFKLQGYAGCHTYADIEDE